MKQLLKNKLFLLGLGLLIVFLVLLGLVLNSATDSIDEAVTRFIYEARGAHSDHTGAFYWVNRILTEFCYFYVLTPACVLAVIIGKGRTKTWFFGLGTAITSAINGGIKHFVLRTRPEEIYHMTVENTTSFPSGHSATSMYFYLFLAYIILTSNFKSSTKKVLATISFMMPFLTGITRLNLTVHYLSDVLAGWCLGGAFACFSILLLQYFQNKKTAK